jgi:hypothetical protein
MHGTLCTIPLRNSNQLVEILASRGGGRSLNPTHDAVESSNPVRRLCICPVRLCSLVTADTLGWTEVLLESSRAREDSQCQD